MSNAQPLPIRVSGAICHLRADPVCSPVLTCEELAERWVTYTRLPPDETEAFARDLQVARARVYSTRVAA
jgi:hypothetical protein